jgi:hypothetical protein
MPWAVTLLTQALVFIELIQLFDYLGPGSLLQLRFRLKNLSHTESTLALRLPVAALRWSKKLALATCEER